MSDKMDQDKEQEREQQQEAQAEAGYDAAAERTQELIRKFTRLRKYQCMLSQHALEDLTGVPRQVLIRYEKGRSVPTVRAMNRILEPMGYKLDIVPIEKDQPV